MIGEGSVSSATAKEMRVAFDEAFTRMDFRTLRAALTDAIQSVSGWKSASMDAARSLAKTRTTDQEAIHATSPVENSAACAEEVLREPETKRLFKEFDARFDEAYARLTGD